MICSGVKMMQQMSGLQFEQARLTCEILAAEDGRSAHMSRFDTDSFLRMPYSGMIDAMAKEDDVELMAMAARQFYLEGKTRIEIAKHLNTSRFKVARLLESALKLGIVTITIKQGGLVDPGVSAKLAQRFALTKALAVRANTHNPEELYDHLGRVAARHLTEIVSSDDVLGFDTGRTVSHIADHLDSLPPCDLVQLSGLAGTVQLNGMEILRRVTSVNGGTAYPLYAPMIAVDAASAEAHRQQPGVKTTMKRYRQVTKAVVSIGSWTPPVSQVYDGMTRTERHALLEAGAVAETCALLFDRDGRPVKGVDGRRIGIPLSYLKAVPNVIAVGGGPDKANAIRSLLVSKVVNTVIIDLATARLMLDQQMV
jgi:DNA-binding transcriptional regulator LsrR (DeoR family)